MSSGYDQEGPRIDDPEKLSQNRRIQGLLDRRDKVIDARDQAIDSLTLGQATVEEALAFYRSRIESLILDLWTKFQKDEIEGGKEYLYEKEIDIVTVDPPEELLPDNEGDLAAGEDAPDPKIERIHGLKWFIDNDGTIEKPFTAYTWNPPGERTVLSSTTVPIETLDKAVANCFEFIDEAGIDADIDNKPDDAEFDYSDLLDEDGDDPE